VIRAGAACVAALLILSGALRAAPPPPSGPSSEAKPAQDFPPAELSAPHNVPKVPPAVPLPPPADLLLPFTPSNVNVSNLVGNEAEVSVAINPTNPQNIVAVGHAPGLLTMNTFYSMDGGETWTLVPLGADQDGEIGFFRADPTVAFDDDGNVYAGYFTFHYFRPRRVLFVAKSIDGGQTYPQIKAAVVDPDKALDKEILTTGPDPFSPWQQNVYVAYAWRVGVDWQLHVAASYDGGHTFPTDQIINDDSIAGDDFAGFGVPAVGPDGELYVVWDDFTDAPGFSRIMVDVSFDGGLTWGADVEVGTTGVTRYNDNGLGGAFYQLLAAPDRGVLAVPSIAADRSGGPWDGRLYVAYTVVGGGGVFDTDVVLRHSDDDGASWTSPLVVNDDGGSTSQFLPWLDVDNCGESLGRVAVVFYDARHDADNQRVEAFMAVSEDGGLTVEPNLQISSGQSDQSDDNSGAWFNNYLEYIGVSACNSVACAVWADNSADPADLDFFSDCVSLLDVLPLDVKPGSCPNPLNRKSNGYTPVGLLGTEHVSGDDIDASSVRLRRADGLGAAAAPYDGPPGPHTVIADVGTPGAGAPCDCHELVGDGILDLSLKFMTQEVVQALELNDLPGGEPVQLEVSGTLLDGTEFTARDCIWIVPPGDIDGNLEVNVRDVLVLLGSWGPCPALPSDCLADMDDSGGVGLSDLLALLAIWG
jgi:hypothetical protein